MGWRRHSLWLMWKTPGALFPSVKWRDSAARQAWQEAPRFTELFMPCLEVCEDMQGSQYEIKVTI